MKRIIIIHCFLCVFSITTTTQKVLAEILGPSIYAYSSLHIDDINISVSENRVKYSYSIQNPLDNAISQTFSFPIPPYRWEGAIQDVYKNGYRSLAIVIDGQEVQLERTVQAFVNGKDITAELQAKGVDPLFEDVKAFTREYRGLFEANPQLIKDGYLDELCDANCDNRENFYFAPRWTVAATYYFAHEFQARSSVSLIYTYEPVWNHLSGTLRGSTSWEIIRAGAPLDKVLASLKTDLDGQVLVYWLSLPLSTFGTQKMPTKSTVIAEHGSGKIGFVYASIGQQTAFGESSATIQIRNQPVGGTAQILLVRAPENLQEENAKPK